MLLEYQLDQIKVVDFLLIAKFLARELFFTHPLFQKYLICYSCTFYIHMYDILELFYGRELISVLHMPSKMQCLKKTMTKWWLLRT